LRRGREAATAAAWASVADLRAVQLAIAADTADAYLQIRAYQARLSVARQQGSVQEDLVGLLERRASQGVASDRELRQAQAERERVRASIPPLVAALEAQFNRLDVLMGAQPGTWRGELATAADIPSAPSVSAAEGPPSLLRRRPDVAAAEQRLIAANAQIGQAISEYYPKLSISGLLGLDSIDASSLFAARAAQRQIGAGLRWRLFDFGRVDAEVGEARGGYAEALAAWRETVLTAAGEVETALSDMVQRQERAAALAREIKDLRVARGQAEQAYEAGAISLIEVRDADRDLLAAADDLAQTRADAARDAVAAYRALGGGWRG
jgi:NodT family efflux transporter outer membrane factor (OMF) lipoprotein